MSGPLVSVVTPTLNNLQFLAEALVTVSNQDYSHVELIVIDGGSKDGTVDLLRGQPASVRWASEADGGQSAAINKGWRMASGEILAYLNADDTYVPGAIDSAVEFLDRHPEIDVVYGDCDYVDERGRFIHRYPARPYDYPALVHSAVNYIPQPAVFLRRRVVDSVGWLDETLSFVMDFDYWLRAGLRHSFAHLPVRLATLRIHNSAKSIRGLGRFAAELIAIYQKFFARDDLPSGVRAIQPDAMSNVYYRAASCAYWSGNYRAARRYSLKGWLQHPANIKPPLLLSWFGPVSRWPAERWRGNPYLLQARA